MKNTINQIKAILGMEVAEIELKVEAVLVDGTKIGSDAEALEDGVLVYVVGEDGEKMPLPTGEYEIEGGAIMSVSDGEITSLVHPDSDAKEDKAEEEMSEVKEVDLSNYVTNENLVDALELIRSEFADTIQGLTNENTELKAEVQKLSKLSAVKPLKHNAPQTQEYNTGNKKLDMLLRLKNN
jgi:hypothetical protein